MTTSVSDLGDANTGFGNYAGIDVLPPAVRLHVDPAFRLERTKHARDRSPRRFMSAKGASLAIAGLLALTGVVAAAYTLSKSPDSSASSIALIQAPSLPISQPRQDVPATGVASPATPMAIAPNPVSVMPVAASPPPVRNVAAHQPYRQRPIHSVPTPHKKVCSDCPPIDATDLPPPGPTAQQN
jgi:hypothetical protein